MELKKTITSIFIVPLLKIDRDELKENGFINAYIKDGRKEVQYENAVYLLFKPKDLDRFKQFLDGEYERTNKIVDDYDYEDGFVVVVYTLDQKFRKDYETIQMGKYSRTSREFKDMFPPTVPTVKKGIRREETTLQHRIFNKSEDLKEYWENKIVTDFNDDMEVWSGWDEVKETMNLEYIKKLI